MNITIGVLLVLLGGLILVFGSSELPIKKGKLTSYLYPNIKGRKSANKLQSIIFGGILVLAGLSFIVKGEFKF
jgi:hypothetical protein